MDPRRELGELIWPWLVQSDWATWHIGHADPSSIQAATGLLAAYRAWVNSLTA